MPIFSIYTKRIDTRDIATCPGITLFKDFGLLLDFIGKIVYSWGMKTCCNSDSKNILRGVLA